MQLVSDVHLEFHADGGRGFIDSLDPADVDVLVIAGDFATLPLLAPRLTQACARYPEVVFVTGNHEYYGSSPDEVHALLGGLEDELPNLTWLRRQRVTVAGVRFAGTTLWFADAPGNDRLRDALNDFHRIEGFDPWVYEENRLDQRFVRAAAPHTDVMVTHHLPSPACVHPKWAGSPLNRFFLCDVEDAMAAGSGPGPAFWLHGHTHDSIDVTVGETEVIANPFGYAGYELNPGFDDRLLLAVDTGRRPGGGED